MCFHCIVSVKRLRLVSNLQISRNCQRRQNNCIFAQNHSRFTHLPRYHVEKAFQAPRNSGELQLGSQQPAVKLEQQRNQSYITGQFIEHTKRDVWGFHINILVHLLFSAVHADLLCWDLFLLLQFVEIVAFHLVVRSGWKGACYQFEVVVVLLHQLVHQGGFFFGPTGYCSYHVTIEVVSVFLDAAGY
ncbi:Hypothetical_protein [Hexamita inflata]|uniref:Hypothetical_protein n=1 Tax=Hexamita inflata TaxID=28002 RepID=A0ABP1KZT4_9EUKA